MKLTLLILCLATCALWGNSDVSKTLSQAEPPMVGVLQETQVTQKPYVDENGQSKSSITVGSEHFHELYPAGARAVVLELAWVRAEPSPGKFDTQYLMQKAAEMQVYILKGYRVALDLGMQYPPAWVLELPNARYVNQNGDAFRSEEPGVAVPNAVFNQQIRDAQARYVQTVAKQFKPTQQEFRNFLLIRLGWMKYGELAYPAHEFQGYANSYWAYDDIAQGKTPGLAQGLKPCPTQGWRAGEGMATPETARQFLEWYLDALQNYQDWQIETVRAHYPNTPLAVLYPSWGMRPASFEEAVAGSLKGKSPKERTGEVQRGLDFARLVAGIDDPNVIVYCTWLDSDPSFSDDASADPNMWSPAKYLASLAAAHDPELPRWAENTGGGDAAVLDLCRERLLDFGYAGFFYAFEEDLFDGQGADVGDFKAFAEALREH